MFVQATVTEALFGGGAVDGGLLDRLSCKDFGSVHMREQGSLGTL